MLDKNLAENQEAIVFENGRNALAKVGPGGIPWGHHLISNNIRYQMSKSDSQLANLRSSLSSLKSFLIRL